MDVRLSRGVVGGRLESHTATFGDEAHQTSRSRSLWRPCIESLDWVGWRPKLVRLVAVRRANLGIAREAFGLSEEEFVQLV